MEIGENERIDDLEISGLKIIQNTKWFCFGIDSVLLSDFAREIHSSSTILDLGAGNGILELLLPAKIKNAKITGVEVQEELCELAKRNVVFNKLEGNVNIINANVCDFKTNYKFDAVVSNPPYKEKGTGMCNEEKAKIIARHEELASLEDFVCTASKVLKDKGAFYMVNRAERLADCICAFRKYKLEPKVIKFVHSKVNGAPVLFLIKAVKNANKFLKIEKPLYIYEEDGKYTKEVLEIYGKGTN